MVCSAAPAKEVQDQTVLNWLKEWTVQLAESAVETFKAYVSVDC